MTFASIWSLLPAAGLLWLPMDWLLRGEVRFGQVEQMFQAGRQRRLTAWNASMLVLDPLRAVAGAALAVVGTKALRPLIGGSFPDLVLAVVMAGLLAVGLALQLYTRRDAEYLLAPVGYAAGLIVQLVEPSVAAITLLLAFATLAGLRSWPAFFLAAAVACAGLGFAISELDRVTPAVLGGVLVLPGIAGMLTGRHLMMAGR